MITRFPAFIGPSYTMLSVNIDCQRSVNLYLELNALGTGKDGEIAALVPTPGLTTKLTLPKNVTRGCWTASNGELYWVASSKLYKISSAFVATEIGTLNTDIGYVSIADNGIHVVVVDGTYGYAWTIATNTFSVITDPDFPGADQVTYQDGYFAFNKPDSGQWFISDLNSIDFDALDIATAEGSPDNTIGVISNNQNVQVFGTKSIEVYYNSGEGDFPFARIQGAVIDYGCSAPFSIAKLLGQTYWVGGDKDGSGIVYRMQGYQPQRISTPALETVIRGISSDQLALARAHTYQQGGHLFYCLNLPGTKSTYVYDATTGFWHERTYLNLWSQERHRAECHTVAFGKNLVGDYQNGKIYELDQNSYTDDGVSIARIRTSPHVSKTGKRIRHNSFELDVEAGVGTDGTNQGNNPQAMLRFSDDGGHVWSNERWADIGKIGKRNTRANWSRLGSSRSRVYEVTVTDPVKVVFLGANLDIEEGEY